jgi:alpha-tubulin suppressor-like RCC1 family protein
MNLKKLKWIAAFLLQIGLFGASAFATINDPVVAPVGGVASSPQTVTVTVSESTGGTTLYYTSDGTNPTMSSTSIPSGSTLLLPVNSTLKVQAFQNATTTSSLVTTKYALNGMVSVGTNHTIALKNDGTVWAWGDNATGELGNNSTTPSSNPVQVMVSGSPLKAIAVAADNQESFAIDTNGQVWGWGYNVHGELGTGNNSAITVPTKVGTLTNMVAIASGQHHTVALRGDGTVWAWGANDSGQLGNGEIAPFVAQPVQVVAASGQSNQFLSGIVAISAGASHTLALDNQGVVWSWGGNTSGQLGDADTTFAPQPAPVPVIRSGSSFGNVVGLTAGPTSSFALRSDGTVWSWGDNTIGELGQGTTNTAGTAANLNPTQVSVLTGMTGTMVAVGNQTALSSDGTVWTWGDNSNGLLAVGYTGSYATVPLNIALATPATPSLTATAGNGQTVTDGTFSTPFTISATSGTWVNFIAGSNGGLLGLTSGASQLSPIIGGRTVGGQLSFYLQAPANGSGTVSLTATSGASQTILSAIEQMAQQVATDTPTMPVWGLIILAVLLVVTAARRKQLAR